MAVSVVESSVPVPDGVSVNVEGQRVKVSGAKGELSRDFGHAKVQLALEGGALRVWAVNPKKKQAASVNTIATHLRNMIKGVSKGFTYKMKIVFIHFPLTLKVEGGKVLAQNFLGEKKPRSTDVVGEAKVSIKGDDVTIEGIDIEEVGQTAANIQQLTRIRSKDRRKFLDGVYVSSKE